MVYCGLMLGVTYTLLFISLYFEVFLLVTFLERKFAAKRMAHHTIPHSELPTAAVIVPCFNEQNTVAGTMQSLLALDYPKEKLQIIVVDDGSHDNTLEIAKQFETDPRVSVFHKENGGKHTALNFALTKTDADLIGCLDADSVVSPDALLRIVPVFRDPRIAAVTPGIHVKQPQNLLQHMQKAEYRLSVFNRFVMAALGSVFITPGPFSFFRADVVRELGGWRHAHSTEDLEMALRMQEAGHLIANAPSATVHTSTPATVKALFRQRVRWTYGFLRNAADYRRMIGNRAYGNLGIVILPLAILSIGTGIFFFVRVVYYLFKVLFDLYVRVQLTGAFPHPSFDLFYFNTSVMWFLVYVSIGLILALISIGSFISTGQRRPPAGTPLFLAFYSFLVPVWLAAAVIRAVFKTGVTWR